MPMREVCSGCGKSLSDEDTAVLDIAGRIYCSEVCQQKDRQVICGFCSKLIPDIEKVDGYTQFCSKDCQGKYVDRALSES